MGDGFGLERASGVPHDHLHRLDSTERAPRIRIDRLSSLEPIRIGLALVMLLAAIGCRAPQPSAPADTRTTPVAPPRGTTGQPAEQPRSGARDPWDEARRRGIDFRALGQEPGWYLEIDEGRSMHLVYDYMEREAVTPAPPPTVAGGRTTYSSSSGSQSLSVLIEDRLCHDGMSGLPFPSTVTVTIDGRELRGCGRTLTPEK